MLILRCDRCGSEAFPYTKESLPNGWAYIEDRHLCFECVIGYGKLKSELEREAGKD